MKKQIFLIAGLMFAMTLTAQTGRVGINTTTPQAGLHVRDSSVLFTGPSDLFLPPAGDPPVSGPGTRMMWYADKAAFRAGGLQGTQWDKDNVGNYSAAFGYDARASHSYSFVGGGFANVASGINSFVGGGSNNTASGDRSGIVGGYQNKTTGFQAFSGGGTQNTAAGDHSFIGGGSSNNTSGDYSFIGGGTNLFARSYAEAAFGAYNTDYTPDTVSYWNATDRLFVIGNGSSFEERSNAITVLKNGDTGIGTDNPLSRLHVVGSIRMVDGNQGLARVMTSNANGVASWQPVTLSGWGLTGNSNVNAGSHFIGTTNAIDVIFRRNNVRAGRLGVNNTSFGAGALHPAQTGTFNTALGSTALAGNTSGHRNIAIGSVALTANTEGHNNTAVGVDAMFSNTMGNYNTAVGRNALHGNTNGERNTAVGYEAFLTGNFTNSTALGTQTAITASNQIRLGNGSVASIGGFQNWTNVSDSRFKTQVQENVQGLAFIMKLRPVTYHLDMERLATFFPTPEEEKDRKAARIKGSIVNTGFIAQEVEQAALELGFDFSGVDAPQNDGDYYGLRYATFVAPLVKAVQEQQALIVMQQQEMDALKAANTAQKQDIEKLYAILEAMQSGI